MPVILTTGKGEHDEDRHAVSVDASVHVHACLRPLDVARLKRVPDFVRRHDR